MNVEQFITSVNKMRLASAGRWYMAGFTVNGHDVQIKAYGTWLQIYRIDGVNHAGAMDIKVSQFKQALQNGMNYASMYDGVYR